MEVVGNEVELVEGVLVGELETLDVTDVSVGSSENGCKLLLTYLVVNSQLLNAIDN